MAITTKMDKNLPTVNSSGFTLVEMMITVLLSALIMVTIYSSYLAQQKNHYSQGAIVEMQQNLRAAIVYMTQDIREAGCDPTGLADAKVHTAQPGVFRFTRDIGGTPGQPNLANGIIDSAANQEEDVTYGFSTGTYDSNSNGIVDGGNGADWSSPGELGKNTGAGYQSIADFINAIEFNYILANNTTTTTPSSTQINSIVGVQVSILARAPRGDSSFTSSATFTTAAGTNWGPFNDNFRRQLAITTIQCRNLAMK